jgi:hypothetical protein
MGVNKPTIGKKGMSKKVAQIKNIKNQATVGSGKGAGQQKKASCCGSGSSVR